MTATRKTIEKKENGKWILDCIIDSDIVNILLNDDMIAKYIMKSSMIKSIKYSYGKIYINYGNGTRAIYD